MGVQTFKNLHSSIASKHEQLEKMLTTYSLEHKAWRAMVNQACKNETNTERILESGQYFDETILEAIEILAGEIDQINLMTERAKDVSKNIDESPDEYLREYQTIATDFINGLDDLKNASDKFLAQPKDIMLKN